MLDLGVIEEKSDAESDTSETIIDIERKNCEIAYFGILSEYFGKKYGGYLLSEAINKSFKKSIDRVWVHTCSLDHKNALKNYISRGMSIYNTEKISIKSA